MPETGTFLSRDPIQSEPPYQYVRGNPISLVDRSGMFPKQLLRDSYGDKVVEFWQRQDKWWWDRMLEAQHGDILISKDRQTIIQFVLDDPILRAYNTPAWQPFWENCNQLPTKHPIKLEWFTQDGTFHSTTSPIFAEVWRQKTGSFYYTGLRPVQRTWSEFVDYWGLQSWMNGHQESALGWYYTGLIPVKTGHYGANLSALAIDVASLTANIGETYLVWQAGVPLVASGCSAGGAGCIPGAAMAGMVDVAVAGPGGLLDFVLGIVKMGPTVGSDIVSGQTTIVDGKLRVGESTVHSTITLVAGLIPETHIQLYFNAKQVSYDIDSLTGWGDLLDTGAFDVKAVEIKLP